LTFYVGRPLQHRQGLLAQGDAMLDPRLHAFGRNGPDPRGHVDFGPPRTNDLARASRRQNCELQGSRRASFALAQIGHERADLVIGKCRMMLNPAHSAGGGGEPP
jgi:hypothetical protein